MLTFDRNDRISASDALKLPFFTGPQAIAQITPEIRSLASATQTAIQRGDKSVSIYDANIIFIFPVSSEKSIIGIDPESDRTQIISQTPSDPVQQQIPIPPNAQQSDNQISLQQMSFVQPDVIRGAQIQQSVIVPKASSKQQPKPVPKIQQIQRQVTSSPQPITVNLEVPSGMHGHMNRSRFMKDDTYACMAESSVLFKPNKAPQEDGNSGKTVNY
ncbi:MAG: hypothetical protein EZS28_042549 [Streblomastix strix]|uniref:Uncharacterized protein n=1 Tax=Streblomastix strix TaxID=222440 RepID=A0A5J4TUI6_9EUKA|nr:MAG: hypothetical protein EZS28_042549 [Streblomastix strix]